YIPAEGEAGDGGPGGPQSGGPDDGSGALLPWPTAAAEGEAKSPSEPSSGPERAEDWSLGHLTEEVEATFEELDYMSVQEVARFKQEFDAERHVPPATAALAVTDACLDADASAEDRREFARFLPRVLRASLAAGVWEDAREALRIVRACESPEWSDETFTQEVLQPVSIARAAELLDTQGPASVS